MATVTLEDLWLHEANDNSTYVTSTLTSEQEQTSKAGQVRRYANGNLRSVTRSGSQIVLAVGMELADRADIDQLREWVKSGTVLLYREPRGRKLWGVLYDLDVEEPVGADSGFADASFTFRQVTYDESV